MDIDENTSTLTPNPIRTFHLLHHYADVFLKRTLPTSEDEQDTPVVNVNKNRNRKLSRWCRDNCRVPDKRSRVHHLPSPYPFLSLKGQ
uniref:Uncharacterized protein n=1 Tax=Rhizophagus irregularis (strain DAOM 181602 / DAOM 197198 / MUCL 43194) TaxID=747089 RepID=U9TUH7_RHIID